MEARTPILSCFIALFIAFLCPALTAAPYNRATFDLIERADVVVVGKVAGVGEDAATIARGQTLDGELAEPAFGVSPVTIRNGVGQMQANFILGEEVLLLLKREKDERLTLLDGGQSKLTLKPETRAETLSAVQRLIAISHFAAGDARHREMLREATASNAFLRHEAQRYIISKLSHSKEAPNYADELAALLKEQEADVRIAALSALRYAKAEKHLPAIIAQSTDRDARVAQAASMTLGKYDTPEAAAALIGLTKHADPQLRVRACIDIDKLRRPEAKAALVALLDDPDPQVRAMAPRGLVYWLRRGQADDVLPKLIAMLNDPDENVRARAAGMLGESKKAIAVEPLLKLIRAKQVPVAVDDEALQALHNLVIRGDEDARRQINAELPLVIAALERGGWRSSIGAVGILARNATPPARAALEQAAKSHPNQNIRSMAKTELDRMK